MARFDNPLKRVRVAAPCPAEWERMRGDERVRFCDQCSMNVYNLSDMTRREAEVLLTRTEGRICVRFYRRADGTILTNNCPVGLRALKRRVSKIASATLSAVVSFCAGLGIMSGFDLYRSLNAEETVGDIEVKRDVQVMGSLTAEPAPVPESVPVVGHLMRADSGWTEGRITFLPVRSQQHRAKPNRK
jgi:hypothetical protein